MNSKRKGNSYERDISKKLSKWITGSEDDLIVWRTSGSGSVSTIAKKKGKSAKALDGDFQYLGENQNERELFNIFFFDSKCLGDVHLMAINPKNQKSNQLFNEWKKVFEDASTSNKIPVMFVKATNDRKIPEFIIIPESMWCQSLNHMWYTVQFQQEVYKFKLILQDEFFILNEWKSLISQNSFLAK